MPVTESTYFCRHGIDRSKFGCPKCMCPHRVDTNFRVCNSCIPPAVPVLAPTPDPLPPEIEVRLAECARLIKSLVEDARALGQSSAEVVGASHLAKARAEGRAQGIREAAECAENERQLGVTYVLQSDYDSLLSEINQRGAKARNDGVQAALDVLDEALSGPLAYLDPEDNDGVHSVRGRIYRLLTPEPPAPDIGVCPICGRMFGEGCCRDDRP